MIGEYELDEQCGQQYDIEYVEEVCGRRVVEKHVPAGRISRNVSQSDRGEEDRYAEILDNMSTCGGRYLHATSGKDLLLKLISLKEEEEEEEQDSDQDLELEYDASLEEGREPQRQQQEQEQPDSMDTDQGDTSTEPSHTSISPPQPLAPKLELSPKQFLMLNDALYEQQIHALISGSRRTLRFITEQLTTAVTHELQDAPNFEDMYMQWHASGGNDGDTDAAQWLSPGQEGGKMLTQCRSSLAAASALMRILSCHTPGLDVAPIEEDHIENCVRWVAALIVFNCGVSPLRAPGGSGDSSRSAKASKAEKMALTSSRSKQDLSTSSAASSRATAKANKEVLRGVQKVLQEIGASLLPLVKSTVDTLEVLLNSRRQPDRLCIAAYELGFCALRAEPSCSPRAELVASANSYPLQSVHAGSINLLQTMGCKYPTHRAAILSEIVVLMAATHSGRVVGKNFPVHFSVHANIKHEKGTSGSLSTRSVYGGSSFSSSVSSSSSSASANAAGTGGGSVNDRYVSTSFACLLLFIQSAAGAESAQSLLGESQRLCKGVVNDLLHRATHRDMGMEYRQLTSSLLQQIETALSSPLLPVCAMLLDSLLAKVLSDLFSMQGEKSAASSAKREDKNSMAPGERGVEQGYINFLLDLIGGAGQVLRCVVLGGARTAPAAAASTITAAVKLEGQKIDDQAMVIDKSSSAISTTAVAAEKEDIDLRVLRALKQKLQKKEVEWLARKRRPEPKAVTLSEGSETDLMTVEEEQAQDQEIESEGRLKQEEEDKEVEVEVVVATGTSKATLRSSRRMSSKASASTDDVFHGGSFSIEQTLRILGEVTTVTLDAMAEYEQVNVAGTAADTTGPSKRHTDFGAEPLNVLEQAGCSKILTLLAPVVQAVDVSRHLICEYMRSIAVNTGADGTAYSTVLSLWYKDCIDTNRVEVASYVERCLRAVPIMLQQQREQADRNAVVPTVVTGPQEDHVLASKSMLAALVPEHIQVKREAGTSSLSSSSSSHSHSQDLTCESQEGVRTLWEARMSFEWIQRSYHALLAEWFGLRQYENIVSLLLILLASEQSPVLRARSIKTLNVLFQTDTGLISRQHVCRAVTRCLNDPAISVREETVKLIGCYVLQCVESGDITKIEPSLSVSGTLLTEDTSTATDEYLDGLLLRLRDKGVSVRRAVVMLFRELLLRQLTHPRYAELCLSLLERSALPKEEESIKDTVRATFTELWLTLPKHREFEKENGGSGVRSSGKRSSSGSPRGSSTSPRSQHDAFEIVLESETSTNSNTSAASSNMSVSASLVAQPIASSPRRAYIEHVAMKIVDVLSTATAHPEADVTSTLTSLLHEALHGRKDGDEESAATVKRREQSAAHCAELVRALMEIVLKLEEGDGNLQCLYGKRRSREAQLVGTIATISVFCTAHPPLLMPHMSALLPYLKPHAALNAVQHSDVTLTVCRMLASVAVITDTQNAINHSVPISELNADLTSIALNGNYNNVDAAVRCLAAVAAYVTSDVRPFVQLASKCFTAVQRAAISLPDRTVAANNGKIAIDVSAQVCARVHRYLIVLGAACEHSTLCSLELNELVRRSSIGAGLNKAGLAQLNSPTSVTSAVDVPVTGPPALSRHSSHGSLHSVGSLGQMESGPASTHRDRCAIEEAAACTDVTAISALGPATLNGCTHAAAVFALTLPDDSCEVRAVQALCRVYIGCPKLVTLSQSNGLLARLLSDTYSPLLHQKLLGSLNHMMLAEERRLEGSHTLSEMRSAGVSVGDTVLATASERDSDVSVTAAAVLANLKRLTDFLYSSDSELRRETLELLATLLRQGMLCPLDVIAHLVALQADPEERIRNCSLRLLQTQDDKYGTFVDNRLLDGLEAAFSLACRTNKPNISPFPARRMEIYKEDGSVREVLSTSVFSALYKTMIQPSKTRRLTVVLGTLKRIHVLMQAMNVCRQQLSRALEMHATNASYYFNKKQTVGVQAGVHVTTAGSPFTPAEAIAMDLDAAARIGESSSSGNNIVQSADKRKTECGFTDSGSGSSSNVNVTPVSPTTAVPDVASVLKQLSRLQGATMYLIATLAHLPYESAAEPLQIIQWITRNAPVEASILCKSVFSVAQKLGAYIPANTHSSMSLSNKKKDSSTHISTSSTASAATSTDSSEGAARMSVRAVQASLEAREAEVEANTLTLNDTSFKHWYDNCPLWSGSTHVAASTANTDVDERCSMEEMAVVIAPDMTSDADLLAMLLSGACEARCREALLRLKGFLKASYNLSSERCQAYIAHTIAKEGRAASEIIRTCDDANVGGRVLALTHDFAPVPASAVNTNIFAAATTGSHRLTNGPVKLIHCLASDSTWPPVFDDLLSIVQTCVTDIGRLSTNVHSDDDLAFADKDKGGGAKTKANTSKKRKGPSSSTAEPKSRAPRKAAAAAADSDSELEGESEGEEEEEEGQEEDETLVVPMEPRISSRGRSIKAPVRLADAASVAQKRARKQ